MTVTRTSLDAFDSVNINDRQAEVLAAVEKLGSCSDQEIAAQTGLPINSVTPRRGELVAAGLLIKAGEKLGPTGRRCSVWRIKPRQQEMFAA